CLEQQIQKDSNKLSLELNDQDHLKTTLESLNRDIEDSNNKIDEEMNRIGFSSLKQVEHTINEVPNKSKIELEINKYNQEKQHLEIVNAQLKSEIDNNALQDISELKATHEQSKHKINDANSILSQQHNKLEFNQKKIEQNNKLIDNLDKEL